MRFLWQSMFAVMVFAHPIFAETPIKSENVTEPYSIGGKHLAYFIDKTSSYEIESITRPDLNAQFQTLEAEIAQFGYTASSIWLKFEIENNFANGETLLLEVGTPALDVIEIYELKNETWSKRVFGDHQPFKNREFVYRNILIGLDLNSPGPKTYFLRIKSSGSVIVPLVLYQPNSFYASKILLEGWHFAFYGILAVMIFYNGFIYLAFRSISYLLYSTSTFFLLIFYFGLNGHGFQFLYPNSIFLQNYLVPISISISWILILEFTIRFLSLNQISLILYRLLRISQSVTFLFIPLVFVSLLQVNKYQTIFGIFNAIFVLSSGYFSLFHGYKAARFFVIGWSMFLAGVLLLLFRSLGILPSNFWTTYTMQIGSLFELVFLSLALADKYKYILEENNSVQAELLHTQIKQNENLEASVRARTVQLNRSLSIIKQDLAVAKKIQQNTLMIDHSRFDPLEIVPFYSAISEVGGDFYGINKVTDLKYRIFLADATGHGIQAALITMAIKGIYDNIKNYDLNIQQIMEIFNDEYVQKYGSLYTYLTCIIVDIDLEKQLLEVTSAGHPSCLLIHNDGSTNFPKTGRMIGIAKGTRYDSYQYEFIPGNRLYLFTDGIFEEFNALEEEFGEIRLNEILKNSKELSLKDSIYEVLNRLDQFLDGHEKQDDITILGIGYKS